MELIEEIEQFNERGVVEKRPKAIDLYFGVKPVVSTFIFELKSSWKKFLVFCAISIVFVLLLSYLPYALAPDNPLPEEQNVYLQDGLHFMNLIIISTVCFFFGGIICSEYSSKTGYITFPIINKYKLVVGKYLGKLTFVIGVVGVFYITLGILGIHYYGGPITKLYYQSFLFALLYVLAISSFVTLFSSFMKNVNMAVVSTIMILLIVNVMIDSLIILLYPEFEPIYSLNHAFKLVSYILVEDFPTKLEDRYIERVAMRGGQEVTTVIWLTPEIGIGITVLLLYSVICLVLAALIFKRKQL